MQATKLHRLSHPLFRRIRPSKAAPFSFLTEERSEMDKLCERTPAEQREEYTQPEEEKEAGGRLILI